VSRATLRSRRGFSAINRFNAMSRHRRVTWIAVIVVLSLIGALVWWACSKSDPEVIFAGYDANAMKTEPVSTAVNSARYDGPDLIRPLPEGTFRLE